MNYVSKRCPVFFKKKKKERHPQLQVWKRVPNPKIIILLSHTIGTLQRDKKEQEIGCIFIEFS